MSRDHFVSFYLHDIDSMYHILDRLILHDLKTPLGLGNAVNARMFSGLVSTAYKRPCAVRALVALSSLNEGLPHFASEEPADEMPFERCFRQHLRWGRLVLGLFRRLEWNEKERVVIGAPLKTFRVHKEDLLIVVRGAPTDDNH